MNLTREIRLALEDRFEAHELCEFLQVPIGDFVNAMEDNDWLDDESYDDLLDLVGLREEEDEDYD